MVPFLTKVTCRVFAVLFLATAVAAGVHVGVNSDSEAPDPSELAAEDIKSDAEILDEARGWHMEYSLTAADAGAADKAESIVQVAVDQAKALDESYEEAQIEEENSSSGEPGVDVGPIPEDCNEYSGNREIGCALLLDAGFGLDQMPCLDSLWNKESGWNEYAANPSSGAYGIPQALPGSKMESHGGDWETNPATQIAWGLDYISGRYGTPCSAWQHSQDKGWY